MGRRLALIVALLSIASAAHRAASAPVAGPASVNADPKNPVDLGTLKLDLDALKKWGTRKYSYLAHSPDGQQKVGEGRVILKTTVQADRIQLQDTYEITYRGQKLTSELTHTCRPNAFLAAMRIEAKATGGEGGSFVATIDQGKAMIEAGARKKVMDLPADTVTLAALLRLVTLVPRAEGTKIAYGHSLESEEMNLKKDYLLESLGAAQLEQKGKNIRCTRFQLSGGGVRPLFLWVDEAGSLQKVVMDERKQLIPDDN